MAPLLGWDETSLKKSSRLLFKLSRLPGPGWLWSYSGKTTDSTVCTNCLPLTHIFDVKKTRQLSSIDPASGPDACKPVVVDFSDGQDSARAHWLCCSLIILLWTTICFPASSTSNSRPDASLATTSLEKVCCIQIKKRINFHCHCFLDPIRIW